MTDRVRGGNALHVARLKQQISQLEQKLANTEQDKQHALDAQRKLFVTAADTQAHPDCLSCKHVKTRVCNKCSGQPRECKYEPYSG